MILIKIHAVWGGQDATIISGAYKTWEIKPPDILLETVVDP